MTSSTAQMKAQKKKRLAEHTQQQSSSSFSDAPNNNPSDEYEEEEEKELIDVDFDFFDPKQVDYHGLKLLLCQTFGTTNNDADVHHSIIMGDLANLIISQPHIGSTVKAEGELDPYAIVTILGLSSNQECINAFRTYLLNKTKSTNNPNLIKKFNLLLKDDNQTAWIINERLINMPPQIVLPAFKMLMEEVQWAVNDGEAFEFEYFIIISKTYREVKSELDADDQQNDGISTLQVKRKRTKTSFNNPDEQSSRNVYYFQSEDEIFEKSCECYFDFTFENDLQVSDSRRVFAEMGIEPARRVFLLHKKVMIDVIAELERVLATG